MKIHNVKIINYNNIINNADIEIEGDLITNIIEKPGESNTLLIPGFIDTHIHGVGGFDSMDSQEAVEEISKKLVKFGITTFFPTIMTQSKDIMLESLKNIANAKSIGSKIRGIHSEGPFISLEKKGAHDPKFLMRDNHDFLKAMQKSANGLLRKLTYAPEVGNKAFIDLMHELNIVINIGHSNATYKESSDAIEQGATSTCHLWNAMSGVVNRFPGLAPAVLTNRNIYKEIIADLVHVHEDTIKFSIDVAGADRIVIVSDAIRPAGLEDGEYTSGGLPIEKHGPKITLLGTDTIAGGGATIYTGFLNLIKVLKCSLMDVVKMTSYNAAQNMDLKDVGIIKKGMKADFIIMDNNYKIEEVYINGVKNEVHNR